MRGYSIMSDEERNSILSQHKEHYNGFKVGNVPPAYNPLEIGNYASDTKGITVNNKGIVDVYKNTNINEEVEVCPNCGLNENICECGTYEEVEEMFDGYWVPEGEELDNPEMVKESIDKTRDFLRRIL